jgi:hypothetical protein
MLYYVAKVVLSALVIVAVSEIAKRSSIFAAVIASLPMTSLLAFVWLRLEGTPSVEIARLAEQILWLVLPSLVLFLVLPFLLRLGVAFWLSMGIAVAVTAASYGAMLLALRAAGVDAG